MAIEIIKPEKEGWNSTMKFGKLSVGDYIVLSVEKMHNEYPNKANPEWGSSYLCFCDLFEYSVFDTAQRKVVEEKYKEPLRVSHFMSATIWDKVKEFDNKMVKIQAVETKSGKVAYDVKEYKGDETSEDDISITEVNLDEPISEKDKTDLLAQIKQFKDLKMNEDTVVRSLGNKYPEESIRELYRL